MSDEMIQVGQPVHKTKKKLVTNLGLGGLGIICGELGKLRYSTSKKTANNSAAAKEYVC